MTKLPRAPIASRLFKRRKGLRHLLYRGNLWIAGLAICLIGLLIIPLGVLNLRAYAADHLKLIARSMAYTVEAAAVFGDGQAAVDAMRHIGIAEDVTRATAFDNHGQMFAQWAHPTPGVLQRLESYVPDWILVPPVTAPLHYQDRIIGEIRVEGLSRTLLQFLLVGVAGVLAGLALTMGVAGILSRRLVTQIVQPLDRLAEVAHEVRTNRAFGRRVPDLQIAELHELGNDFNALLDELEAWHKRNENEKASLTHQAFHDSLTGLNNRAAFEDRLGEAMLRAQGTGEQVAVLFIDGDRFKSINDRLGHAAGDAVLIAIAERIRRNVRKGDVVVRLGGDEFAVMLTSRTGQRRAEQLADAILNSMKAPITLPGGGSTTTSLSVGIALYPTHGDTPDTLLHAADVAMYQAKRQGPGSHMLATSADAHGGSHPLSNHSSHPEV